MDELTKKQQGFVRDYIDTGNGTQAALNNYDTDSEESASTIASENLRKVSIRQAIDLHAKDAESMVYKLSQTAEAETVRLGASKDILDRAGFKPIEKTQTLNVTVTLDEKSLAIARKYEEELKSQL